MRNLNFIDTHAHYMSRRFERDRDILLPTLLSENVKAIVECGTNTYYNKKAIELAEKYDNVFATIGYFPCDTFELEKDPALLQLLEKQLSHPKVLGIGEIGLDYFHRGDINIQKKWFVAQLELARKLDVPVCIHSRNATPTPKKQESKGLPAGSEIDAEKDTLDILKDFGPYRGVIHCYAYGEETMKELVELGYYFGVGGTCTYYAPQLRKAIKAMPMDRIVLETDCPYLTPIPFKGQKNDSGKIPIVISEISRLKGISEEDVIEITNENAKKLYPKLITK